MTKEIKKSNEGFSLVELIIVIAIMAILVGVVALQVVPYMEKSREGKDMSQLDSCFSAFQTAIAEQEISGEVAHTKYTGSASLAAGADDAAKCQYAIQQSLGMTGAELDKKLNAGCNDGASMYFQKTGTTITVSFEKTSGTATKGKYNNKDYKISSGTAGSGS